MTERAAAKRDLYSICFGLIVRRLRLQRGWTILQLADAVGYSRVHVGVIERGGNSPNLQTFLAFCWALGADPADVLREVLQNTARLQNGAPA